MTAGSARKIKVPVVLRLHFGVIKARGGQMLAEAGRIVSQYPAGLENPVAGWGHHIVPGVAGIQNQTNQVPPHGPNTSYQISVFALAS